MIALVPTYSDRAAIHQIQQRSTQWRAAMSAARERAIRKAEATDFKSEIDYAIWCKVHGEPSPWLIDSQFEVKGSFEDRFRAGDKQILLWELDSCARTGERIPQWAADALYDILYGMAKGSLSENSWNDAFGKPYADRKQPGGMRTRAQMFDAYREVRKLVAEKKVRGEKRDYDQKLYEEAGQRLRPRLSSPVVKKLYGLVKKSIEIGEWTPWTRL
jgi:hypothetical protein